MRCNAEYIFHNTVSVYNSISISECRNECVLLVFREYQDNHENRFRSTRVSVSRTARKRRGALRSQLRQTIRKNARMQPLWYHSPWTAQKLEHPIARRPQIRQEPGPPRAPISRQWGIPSISGRFCIYTQLR